MESDKDSARKTYWQLPLVFFFFSSKPCYQKCFVLLCVKGEAGFHRQIVLIRFN